ncbi:PREDICTED: uncharacterized protein LOC104599817 isoform X3 [Nelumbo nucifera]|uniref:Uncharacterized protein LOC104599817 isoform X3 n=1 Tax=Nelumbo nucifera TaxID=4432 RepID=A0A1U8AEU9_NELNU|nr:PREDICTED: uncharacterized protein LOC104599817 isoform X3 [Nelumbo nucifera]
MQRRNSDNIVVTVDQERKKSKSKKNGKVDLENIPEEIIFGILANIPAHNLYEFRPEFRVYNSIYVATKRFLNNVAGFHEDEEAFDEDEEYMYSMDMVHETFHMTRLPVSAYGREDGLFELGDVLALTTRIERTSRYDIWVLKDFHKGDWVKQYSVVLEGVQFAYKHDYNALKPVGSLRKGKVIIFQEHIYFYAADVEVGKEDLETPGS